MCAFTFCWWAYAEYLESEAPPGAAFSESEADDAPAASAEAAGRGKKEDSEDPVPPVLAGDAKEGEGIVETWVMLWRYWRAFSDKLPPKELRALLERVFSGKGLCLNAH